MIPLRRRVHRAASLWIAPLCFAACLAACAGPGSDHLGMRRDPNPFQGFGPRLPEREPAPEVEPQPAAEEPVLPPTIGGSEKVSFEMREMPLAQALHMIASSAGVNIYLDAGLGRAVDASFPAVTLDDALHVILAQNGLRLVEEPPGIFWVARNDGSSEESRAFALSSVDAAGLEPNLRGLISSETTLVVDTVQNFVLARGPQRDIELVAAYIERADQLKPQVLVEVRIVEILMDEDFELGLQHQIEGATGSSTNNVVSLFTELATTGDAFSLVFENPTVPITSTLNALREYATLNLISSPRVLAVTNTDATVEVVTEIPYVQATVSTDVGTGGVGSSSTEEIQFKEAGVRLKVRPVVQEGGIIQIQIDNELSEVVDFFLGVPVIDTRQLVTQMLVANGQTVVLGGLLQNRMTETDTGVPLLMDLPFLGRLFRSDVEGFQRRELLLFLTPQVVDPHQAAELAELYDAEYRESVQASGLPDPEAPRAPEAEDD